MFLYIVLSLDHVYIQDTLDRPRYVLQKLHVVEVFCFTLVSVFTLFQSTAVPQPSPQYQKTQSNIPTVMMLQPKQNKLVPVEKPEGIDPITALNERENRSASRHASASLTSFVASKHETIIKIISIYVQ